MNPSLIDLVRDWLKSLPLANVLRFNLGFGTEDKEYGCIEFAHDDGCIVHIVNDYARCGDGTVIKAADPEFFPKIERFLMIARRPPDNHIHYVQPPTFKP